MAAVIGCFVRQDGFEVNSGSRVGVVGGGVFGERIGGWVEVYFGVREYRAIQREGDVADGADVLGDVVAGGAVAAGGGVFEGAIFVEEGDGDAVDFWLHGDGNVLAAEVFLEALVEGDELGFGELGVFELEDVVDAEHGDRVGDLGEAIEGFRADAVGG